MSNEPVALWPRESGGVKALGRDVILRELKLSLARLEPSPSLALPSWKRAVGALFSAQEEGLCQKLMVLALNNEIGLLLSLWRTGFNDKLQWSNCGPHIFPEVLKSYQ